MDVDGSCHCGQITFRAKVDPKLALICHCNDCQITAGAAFTFSIPAAEGTFEIINGSPSQYIKTTADSGRHRAHGFCSNCATRIYSASVNTDPIQYILRAGSLNQRSQIKPNRQIWCNAALDWALVDGVKHITKQT